jgi:hypothetical protein
MRNLPTSWQGNTESTLQQEQDSISIYTDKKADTREIIAAQVLIKRTYPALHRGFYDTLDDRIRANNFTTARLRDAVSFVIDNCRYPTPTIADFISFDRTVKFKTYDEMCLLAERVEDIWEQWLPVKFPDRPKVVWIHANDIEKYKLQDYQIKKSEEKTK